MKKFNITIPRKYIKDNQEKTQWNTVGTLVRFEPTEEKEEGYILELHMFPNTSFKVFPQEKKEVTSTISKEDAEFLRSLRGESKNIESNEEVDEINPDDIPF